MKRHVLQRRELFLFLSCVLLHFSVSAQKSFEQVQEMRKKILSDPKIALVNFSEERQTPVLIKLNPGNLISGDIEVKKVMEKHLNVRTGIDNMLQNRKSSLPENTTILDYQQYYKGVKVDRAGYKAFIKSGQLSFLSGAFYDIQSGIITKPAITEQQALGFAKKHVNAKKYAWEQSPEDIIKNPQPETKAVIKKAINEYLPKGEVVLIRDFTRKDVTEMRLAYKFNIYAAEPLSRGWVYVDAENGKILLYDKIIKHVGETSPYEADASTNAKVQTRYAGQQIIKTKAISGNDPNSGSTLVSSHPSSEPTYVPGTNTYVLIDDTRGNGIETYDLNGAGGVPLSVSAFYAQGKSFTDVDNNWTNAEHHRSPGNDGALEAENDDIAWDAHWGAEVVYDYWLAKHGRLSYDGKNAKILNFIHYGPAYDNAFWNGTAMTYGDGSGPAALGFKALTSLDVCGHEIGHGVCSYTSDLIYQSESGAMNEALSDIWAACVENFAMRRSGSTVPSTAFRPFYIGEQIGADYNSPLRRMDNPKQQGNPDTYGGTNWENPSCTPTLANDQCGVHTNSGVLNKWFFLITAGSKTGTRPAGFTANQYYFADSDDEINDQGETYKVNGIGFDMAEKVTFMMETMLTSAATYAEARDVSIQVAISLSGDPCSALVETVTNAWYAVGVGNQFVKPCVITYGFGVNPGLTVNEASSPSGCTSQKTYTIPVLLPGNSSATVTATGTAKSGIDFSFSPSALSNTGSADKKQTLTVTVKNDAVVESDETFTLNIAINNIGSKKVNKTYTFTITDDDVVPVIGNSEKTLLSETFTRADGFADPTGWAEKLQIPETSGDPAATGKNQWGIFDNKLAITGKDGLTNTQFPKGTYNSNSESNTIISTPLLDARGLGVLNIKFDYRIQGEVDVASGSTDIENLPVFDYMAVCYSLDGINFVELNTSGFRQFASVRPQNGTLTATLPVSLSNKKFYLGFKWSNDTNAGGPESVSVDNLVITGKPRRIDNSSKNNSKEILAPGQEVYFYSIQEGEVLGKIKNNSTNDFGCTNVILEKSGMDARTLYKNGSITEKVAGKIMQVIPSAAYSASTTVTFYYYEDQIKSVEKATGKSRTAFSIYQIKASSYTAASAANTKKYPATYTSIPGVGGYFTATFTEKLTGSYAVGAPAGAALQRAAIAETENSSINVIDKNNWKFGSIYPNPGKGEGTFTITVPEQQQVKIDVSNIYGQTLQSQSRLLNAGTSQINVGLKKLTTGKYIITVKNNAGKIINTQSYIKQ